ncbi:MAG: hypothetical protein ACD_21C00242G0001 [uncultured bacterium]|nr:MAG: hypothetical protein ACD_21C00242G0001 [uncultured bacterium]
MIHSMTTFARFSDQGDWGMATWEIRAVNHRYFDCTIKMPEILRSLETNIRLQLQQQLHRGRIECMLRFQPGEQSGLNLMLNTSLVKKLADAIGEVKTFLPTAPEVDPMKILSWPQVLQTVEADAESVHKIILQLFEKTLVDLIAAREREGAALAEIIKNKLQEVLIIAGKVKNKIPQVLADQRAKIVARLEEIKSGLDQARLEQEMVYLAQRIDVAEELDRLETHCKEIKRILTTGGNVGKRLDFLMQELNREANTLSSKSVDVEVTQAAVVLKVLIEQMREQVQNIV